MRSIFVIGFILLTTLSLKANDAVPLRSTLEWSPDNSLLAAAYSDGSVVIQSLNDPSKSVELKHAYSVTDLAWDGTSTQLATATAQDGRVYIWDVVIGRIITSFQVEKSQSGRIFLAWNTHTNILAAVQNTGDGGYPIRFWNTQDYSLLGFTTYKAPISLEWSPRGNLLMTTSDTGSLAIYDRFTGENIESRIFVRNIYNQDPINGISNASWSPDGMQLAVIKFYTEFNDAGGLDSYRSVAVYDAATLKEVRQFTEPVINKLNSVDWSPDGTRIAVLQSDGLEILDAQDGTVLERIPVDEATNTYNVAWSPFGGQLAVAGASSTDSTFRTSAVNDIEILVPAPSLALLDSIEAACVPAKVLTTLPEAETLAVDITNTEKYVQAVQSDPAIPTGCATDLIAVAEALQAEQERR